MASKSSTIQPICVIITQVYVLLRLLRKPVLTSKQLEHFSNILDNVGQGFFVVFLLTPFVDGFDKTNPWVLVLGAIAVAICWTTSLIVAKRGEIET